MDKNYKHVYVRGTKSGTGVIEALVHFGGKNDKNFSGTDRDSIYYINPEDNIIHLASEYSDFGKYIIATAKELKPFRWRAEKNSPYYMVDDTSKVTKLYDYRDDGDEKLYKCGNYFRTEAEAQKMAEKIKKILLPD